MRETDLRKVQGIEESTWTTTPYGPMPFYSYRSKNSDVIYINLIKSFTGDTLEFNWAIYAPISITTKQARDDTIDKFSAFGPPLIYENGVLNDEYDLIFNCRNCDGEKNIYCSGLNKIEYDLCVSIRFDQRGPLIAGTWLGWKAKRTQDLWIEKNRSKVKF